VAVARDWWIRVDAGYAWSGDVTDQRDGVGTATFDGPNARLLVFRHLRR
jgi:hypothetical protein